MTRYTYTWGTTPKGVIHAMLPDAYAMTLNAYDREAVVTALMKFRGQRYPKRPGVKRDAFDAENTFRFEGYSVKLSRPKMLALLDALGAIAFTRNKVAERAASLRGSILETIGIEEV